MQAKDFGPVTESMFQREEGEAPAFVREWGGRLSRVSPKRPSPLWKDRRTCSCSALSVGGFSW